MTGTEQGRRTVRGHLSANAASATAARGMPDVARGRELLRKYREGKASLERRIVENEEWWRLRHWKHVKRKGPQEKLEPTSAWLFNSLLNKHADAMDNYPEPVVLPREEADQREAALLSQVLPALLERCDYEQTYSDVWWYKLKMGTGVQGVFWNPACHGGLGDVEIRRIDLLNLFWEPGVREIQQSRNVFHVEYFDRDALMAQYPHRRVQLQSAPEETARYAGDDPVDLSGKIAVVDWYYKTTDRAGREALHYCKFAGEAMLYASERDPSLRGAGFYAHGRYPFVFDTLFTREDAPVGFGFLDVMKDAQTCIDRLNALLLNHALMAGRKRFFVRLDGGVNEQEFADWGRDFVHVTGSLSEESIREIKLTGMDAACLQMLSAKVDELKETSGNREFSQGGTTAGVTAASAISALQEAGSKLSRDMVRGGYRAFTQVCTLVIELMRQFYTEPRAFRIAGEGEASFVTFGGGFSGGGSFSGGGDADGANGDGACRESPRVPAYDIRIRSQRANPFSTMSQNETAKELFRMGFFRRENAESALMCLRMMRFEGVAELRSELERMLAENRADADAEGLLDGLPGATPPVAALQAMLQGEPAGGLTGGVTGGLPGMPPEAGGLPVAGGLPGVLPGGLPALGGMPGVLPVTDTIPNGLPGAFPGAIPATSGLPGVLPVTGVLPGTLPGAIPADAPIDPLALAAALERAGLTLADIAGDGARWSR